MNLRHTYTKLFTAALAAACILGHGAALHADASQLVLTEINSNATGGDFWELTNTGTTAVGIGGFKWDDDSQNASDAAAVTVPAGTSIAAGESILFAVGTATAFRAEWGALPGVQIISGGPGLGGGDGVALFDASGTKLFFFSYAANGFTRSNGSGSAGGHAGASAGGTDSQSAVIDPNFGVGSGRRYAAATAGTFGAYAGASSSSNVGSPGTTSLSPLILTEINSNVAGGDFWELTNVGTVPMSIGNWKWDDDSQNPADAAAVTIPAGTTIAAGESVVLVADAVSAATFRTNWGALPGVQIISASNSPGLGQNDGVALFDVAGTKQFFFSYASGAFTRSSGSSAAGGHAGISAGGSATQSAVIDPTFGSGSGRRYAAATAGTFGAYANTSGGSNLGSPGVTGLTTETSTITLSLSVTPATFSESAANPAATGTVSRATSGTTDLVVSLSSSDTTEATVPATVTILANQTSATFNVSAVDDALVDGSQTVTITATAAAANSPTFGVTVQDNDTAGPVITSQPVGTTITTGYTATLSLGVTGSPTPTIQWYQGAVGTTTTPVGSNSSSFTTPALTATTSYWARVSNTGGSADSSAAVVMVTSGVVSVDLATYVRVARYNLPEYRRTALPAGTASSNLLCDEASGVTYNWDTDTLFICGDGGRAITQVTKTGQLVNTMSLALNAGNPQGTEFYDPEGITYIGSGQFVFTEERERRLVKFTYAAGTTLTRAAAQTVDIGTFDDNTGTEGLSYDPQTNNGAVPGFIVLKEKSPIGVFQTNLDFAAGTATNGSASAANSTNLFDTTLLGMSDVADVFAFSNIPSMTGQPQAGNMLILGQENARILNVSRSGQILSTLNITADAGSPLSAADQQHEGITMDRTGMIYVVNENGGGSIEFPQLWVYASTTVPNQAPAAVAVNNAVTSLEENTSTASTIKVGDIAITDDGLGTNVLSLSGADAAAFQITGAALYLKAGIVLDYETKTSYAVTISVDDSTVGSTPDATANFTLSITDQVVETQAAASLLITEVAPWSSSNGAVGGDWFEVTNVSASAVDVTGWKVDDDSNAFATAIALTGITSIAPGESVIFIESSAANQATIVNTFKTVWFGGSAPAGLQIGTYQGGSIGLSTGGDQVNLYTAGGSRHSGVSFGAADVVSPFQSFDNTAAANNTAINLLSTVGVNGAFVAATSSVEIGSPGYSAPGVLRITEVAAWGSGNSPAAADWFEVTNVGARAVDMTGWKIDDSSESPAAALALTGISSIAPGESVIYMETATLATTRTTFLNTWFGASPPAGLQIGGYTGSGAGLSTGGDAVNLFDSNNVRRANVAFGLSPSSAPFASFDNAGNLNVATLSLLSAVGVNGAFAAVNDTLEVGSPGSSAVSGPQTFSTWLALNGFSGSVGGDTDGDGLPDTLEYFFNASPNGSSNEDNLPQLARNGSDLEFRFSFLSNAVLSGYLQWSKDLVTWANATPGIDYEVITETVNGTETAVRYRIFTDPTPTAQGPFTYVTPFTSTVERGAIGPLTITNHGMVGAGRLTGEQLDVFGETMGASSGLFITGWDYNAGTGQFSGSLNVLPDRGYNSGDIYSNYAARVHDLPFTFTPYYGTTAVGQTQLSISYGGTTKFTYLDGATMKYTTGLNPTGNGTLFGQAVGTVTTANGPGGSQQSLLSFDAEALHVFADGSGFVSDEYGTYIARFNSSKQITGITQLPAAARPYRPAGTPNFDSITPPTTGRRNNQGLEGMSVSPDNTRLFALMQSALVQDTGTGTQGRYNTRLFVYNIAGANVESPVLIGEHAVQLPRYTLNGNGGAVNNMAAQSEVIALSNTQLLTLPRDGNGLGKGDTNPPVIKTVDLVDFSAATNILGLYDAEGGQISPGAILNGSIVPAKSTVVVNMLSTADLSKFGFNLNTASPTQSTVSEKIEGMALVPDLSTPDTSDFFLFVGNDNDFRCSDVRMLDTNGNVVSYGDQRDRGITNDATFTVWRISIHPDNRKFFRINVDTTP